MSKQWLTKTETRVLKTNHWNISPCSLARVCRCSFDDAGKVRRLIRETVITTQRFYYSAYPVFGCYSWLLLAVSLTRHFQLLAFTPRFVYSTYPMHFPQTFHYPTFQLGLLDVSAFPKKCVAIGGIASESESDRA